MDIRPIGSGIPHTSALDALRRVQGSAAAGDSEDSQTAGYLSGDAQGQASPDTADSELEEEAEEDVVDISAESLAGHVKAKRAPQSEATLLLALDVHKFLDADSAGPDRRIDIQA